MKDAKPELPDIPLGQQVAVPDQYDPGVLAAVPRLLARREVGLLEDARLPFVGEDLWRCWEFAWQDLNGAPAVGVLELRVPCDSPCIVESKSLKLYLHGVSCGRFADAAQVIAHIREDLSAICGSPVRLRLLSLQEVAAEGFESPAAESLDSLKVPSPDHSPAECVPEVAPGSVRLQRWHTDLFSSLCPVTAQPDWASVTIHFEGPQLEPVALQRYLLAYRGHAGFHESCAERIFLDLHHVGSPVFLSVLCRFTRRGGIDISPYRASTALDYTAGRLVRQ